MRGRSVVGALLSSSMLLCAPAAAHEFWIEPQDPTPTVGERLLADLRVGQRLSGDALAWNDERFNRFSLFDAGGERSFNNTDGTLPAVDLSIERPGLQIFVAETNAQSLRYPDFEKFETFLAEEGESGIAARHRADGLPTKNIIELYTRHAKALAFARGEHGEVAEGARPFADRPFGLAVELVALTNPYASKTPHTLSAQLLFDGEPRADHQVSVFHRDATGKITRDASRTDLAGRVSIDTSRPGFYLLSSVKVRRPTPRVMLSTGAMWESLWASLTFSIE